MYPESGFKYRTCRISKEFDGRHQYNTGDFYHSSRPIRLNHYNKSVYTFFSDRKREHYDELNNNVFVWLDDLHIEFLDDENPHYILEKIQVTMGKDTMFYYDARRHMPKKMKQNIENLEKNLNAYNTYIQTINIIIDNSIKGIIARPPLLFPASKLKNEQISIIYRLVKTGFSQAIKGEQEVSTFIKDWDFSGKLKSHGFIKQEEIDNASNLLGIIQDLIMDHAKQAQSNIIGLRAEQEVIKRQSKQISSRIVTHRYRAHHRCCPSLIKELWHTLF